jgi:hypothetical protein
VDITRRFAIALLCLVARLVQLLVVVIAFLIYLPVALVMLAIALAVLAFMAVDEMCGNSPRNRTRGGTVWSARPRAAI